MNVLSLVPLADVVHALERLEVVQLRGETYLSTDDVLRVFQEVLTRAGTPVALVLDADKAAIPPLPENPPFSEPISFPIADPALEAERVRLAALPPGPCVCASRFQHVPTDPRSNPALHVHPHGPCTACGSSSAPCDDYVDTVERDPIQVRLMSGEPGPAPEEIPALYQPEPVFDPSSRPPPRSAPQPHTVGGPSAVPEYDPTPSGPVLG